MPTGDYPAHWPEISRRIRARAGGQCECTGQCGLHRGNRCLERDGQAAQWANGQVVLTVAHLNHYPPDCRDENLLAMCQTCHLRYDQVLHARNAHETRRSRRADGDLFA
jgi:hypothetical protein